MRSDVVVADKGWPTPSSGANVLLAHVSKREEPSGIEALIRRHITYERLEDAVIPIHVMATDVLTGAEVRISRGPVVEALRASMQSRASFHPSASAITI